MSETPDPTRLMELAKAATPGPWTIDVEGNDQYLRGADGKSLMCDMQYYPWTFDRDEDWEYVAAFNPQTAIALLTQLADLQAENARLTAALNQVNGCRMQPCPQCREFITAALTPKGETP